MEIITISLHQLQLQSLSSHVSLSSSTVNTLKEDESSTGVLKESNSRELNSNEELGRDVVVLESPSLLELDDSNSSFQELNII
jgi:hypothetical protein